MPSSIQVIVPQDDPPEVKLWLPDGTPLGDAPRRLGFQPPKKAPKKNGAAQPQ